MKREEIRFTVETKDGVVTRIGHSFVHPPKTTFKVGTIKWYQDKMKDISPDRSCSEFPNEC